jgi:hypothetical protein
MIRPRTTFLMGTVSRGEYVVDPRAVAEAILDRVRNRRGSPAVLEAVEVGADRSVGSAKREPAAGPDLA